MKIQAGNAKCQIDGIDNHHYRIQRKEIISRGCGHHILIEEMRTEVRSYKVSSLWRTGVSSQAGRAMVWTHKSELKMSGYGQEPTWNRGQRAGKINCGQIREGIKCQANEFGFCSQEAPSDL